MQAPRPLMVGDTVSVQRVAEPSKDVIVQAPCGCKLLLYSFAPDVTVSGPACRDPGGGAMAYSMSERLVRQRLRDNKGRAYCADCMAKDLDEIRPSSSRRWRPWCSGSASWPRPAAAARAA